MEKTDLCGQEGQAPVKYHRAAGGYYVGQEGEFLLHDSFSQPIETVRGKIVTLVEGQSSLYALLRTDRGIRPGRLS